MSIKTTVRATGHEAIEIAEREGLTLVKYADPTEEARDGLTPDEARRIAVEDPGLIYISRRVDGFTTRRAKIAANWIVNWNLAGTPRPLSPDAPVCEHDDDLLCECAGRRADRAHDASLAQYHAAYIRAECLLGGSARRALDVAELTRRIGAGGREASRLRTILARAEKRAA